MFFNKKKFIKNASHADIAEFVQTHETAIEALMTGKILSRLTEAQLREIYLIHKKNILQLYAGEQFKKVEFKDLEKAFLDSNGTQYLSLIHI